MQADAVIKSEAIFTALSDETEAGTIAIKDDKIVFVGSNKEASQFVGKQTVVYDFEDALVIPGFHDSHIHLFHSALYNSDLALSYMGSSEQDCVDALIPLAARRPPGSWLLSQGWREYRWKNPQTPHRSSLDAVFPDRPVAMYSGDAHTLWLNSVGLDNLGIDHNSVAPEGGSYDRDEQGNLTGIIRETAAMELMPRIVGSFTDNELRGIYQEFIAHLTSQGITSVCDMALMPYPGLDFVRDDIYESLEQQGELPIRVHLFPTLLHDMERFENLRARFTGPKLQASGLKQFYDGVSSQHTAFLSEPYQNARFEGERGRPNMPFETMKALVTQAANAGYAVRIHTIGDEAIHQALDIIEEAYGTQGNSLPIKNCLEHLENLQPDDINRLAQLGVVAAVQPGHINLDPGGPERDLGPKRTPYMWPFKSFLEKGVSLAFGTDSPVVPTSPLDTIYAAVTRQDPYSHQPIGGWLPGERISTAQAIRSYTLGSANAAGRAHELGTLEKGKFADIAVLDRNIIASTPEDLQGARITATFVGGECVYHG